MFNIAKLNPFHRSEPEVAPEIDEREVLCKVVGVISDKLLLAETQGFLPMYFVEDFLADLTLVGDRIGYDPTDPHHHTLDDWDAQEGLELCDCDCDGNCGEDAEFDIAVNQALGLFR